MAPREPTLEGTLEKQKSEGYFGSISRMFGMTKRGWKMRHFVLYDNHLFWGRGFSRMYGYGTVLSAKPAPEEGETAFSLELVTHPKFSLRRGGYDSLDYMQRLYGLCCSTHGYSVRVMRAGTVLDRDRWISSLQRGLPPPDQTRPNGTNTPTSPIDAIDSQEQSVFGLSTPKMSPRSSPEPPEVGAGAIARELGKHRGEGRGIRRVLAASGDQKVPAGQGARDAGRGARAERAVDPARRVRARRLKPRRRGEAAAHAAMMSEAAAAEEEAAREAEEEIKAKARRTRRTERSIRWTRGAEDPSRSPRLWTACSRTRRARSRRRPRRR